MNPIAHSLSAFRHSVRSELNQILGYAELLSQEQSAHLPEECIGALQRIQQSARQFLSAFGLRVGTLSNSNYIPQLLQDPTIGEPMSTIGEQLRRLLGMLPNDALADLRHMQQAHLNLREHLSGPIVAPKNAPMYSPPAWATSASSEWFLHTNNSILRGKVLVIDDSSANRELLHRQLKEIGAEAIAVDNGHAGLEELAKGGFDCVLLDMVIPEMDGPAVLRAIRANSDWIGIPVLMLSALEELREAAHCIEIGADDYLLRPVELPLLRAKLHASISRKLLYEDCQRLGKDLAHANEELKRFLMVASHDLQSPLRTLERQLLQVQPEANVQESLQLCRRMNGLVQDLLVYARMGQVEPFLEDIPLDWVISEVRSNLSSEIEESSARLSIGEMPSVRADFKQMIHLFQNLIANAIRYCSSGTPEIQIAAQPQDDRWLISVSDNGCGIPEDQRSKIFGAFHRLHGDDIPGTGLGLAIAQRAVEQSKGKIWVDSVPGEGSTFWILLPAA